MLCSLLQPNVKQKNKYNTNPPTVSPSYCHNHTQTTHIHTMFVFFQMLNFKNTKYKTQNANKSEKQWKNKNVTCSAKHSVASPRIDANGIIPAKLKKNINVESQSANCFYFCFLLAYLSVSIFDTKNRTQKKNPPNFSNYPYF